MSIYIDIDININIDIYIYLFMSRAGSAFIPPSIPLISWKATVTLVAMTPTTVKVSICVCVEKDWPRGLSQGACNR